MDEIMNRIGEVYEPFKVHFLHKPVRPLAPDEVLVKVRASAICGSDLHIARGLHPSAPLPVTIGHEFSGDVVAIGSYIAAMGGVDAIVFTGGIGEHDADSRAKICHHMDWLGIRVDTDKNANAHKQNKDVVEITAWGAKVRTLVIETNEELMIARDTKEVLGNHGLA